MAAWQMGNARVEVQTIQVEDAQMQKKSPTFISHVRFAIGPVLGCAAQFLNCASLYCQGSIRLPDW
jgi:hypothetical protein